MGGCSSTCSAFDTSCPLLRYDGLVGMFDPKGRSVPCVGVSQSEVCSMKRGLHTGEHRDRATLLDHGNQPGQAAEANPHC